MGKFDLKKYLVENRLTSNSRILKENSLQANDKSIEILNYNFPYMTLKQNGKVYEIEFDDFEIMDSHGNEGYDGLYYGYDQHGNGWDMEIYLDYHGEIEEVFPETIQKGMGHGSNADQRSTGGISNITVVKDDFLKNLSMAVRENGKIYNINFDDYEIMDSHGNEGSVGVYYGTDQYGDEWNIEVSFDFNDDLEKHDPKSIQRSL